MNKITEEFISIQQSEEELNGTLRRVKLLREIMQEIIDIDDLYAEAKLSKRVEILHRMLRKLGLCQPLKKS